MRCSNNITSNDIFLSGLELILSVAVCYVIASISYILGVGISYGTLPVALVLVSAAIIYVKTWRDSWRSIVYALIVWVIAVYSSTVISDSSYDGPMYHYESVFHLYNGWNPYLNPDGITGMGLWAKHYPKAMEIVGACVMHITQRIQSSKAIMLILFVGLLFILPTLFRRVSHHIGKKQSVILALLVVCNPVLNCQILHFYVDDVVYICVVLAIIAGLLIAVHSERNRIGYVLIATAIIIGAGTKANALIYVIYAIVFTLIGLYLFGDRKLLGKYALWCIVVGFFSGIVLVYHPYITNWVEYGHPLYPLMGEGKTDIMTGNTPDAFADGNRVVNFFKSIYSVSLPSVDQREGGFFMLFMLLFPMSIGSIIYCACKRKNIRPVAYIAACIVASCFFFEQTWWARYIPQLWLVVPLSVYALMVTEVHKLVVIVRHIIVGFGCGTGCIGCCGNIMNSIAFTIYADGFYAVLRKAERPFKVGWVQIERMLYEQRVPIQQFDKNSIPENELNDIVTNPMELAEWYKVLDLEQQESLDSLSNANIIYTFKRAIRKN